MPADRRVRALSALAGGVVVVCAPGVLARLAGPGIRPDQVVRVELAGSGTALLHVASADRQALATHRLLTELDNAYIAVYTTALLLGIGLLPPPWRAIGLGLTALTAGSDLIENAALVKALRMLETYPTHPQAADPSARLARTAALVKFAALVPAGGLALWGATTPMQREGV
jgi:hypothetical protein